MLTKRQPFYAHNKFHGSEGGGEGKERRWEVGWGTDGKGERLEGGEKGERRLGEESEMGQKGLC